MNVLRSTRTKRRVRSCHTLCLTLVHPLYIFRISLESIQSHVRSHHFNPSMDPNPSPGSPSSCSQRLKRPEVTDAAQFSPRNHRNHRKHRGPGAASDSASDAVLRFSGTYRTESPRLLCSMGLTEDLSPLGGGLESPKAALSVWKV